MAICMLPVDRSRKCWRTGVSQTRSIGALGETPQAQPQIRISGAMRVPNHKGKREPRPFICDVLI